jgi:hypothetical protein
MLKSLLKDKLLLALLFLTILIKILSFNESWIEQYYTYGFYPVISQLLRILFGWLPFSFGDLVYLGAVIYIFFKAIKFLRILQQRRVKQYMEWVLLRKILRFLLWVYLIFNIFWGLNYNRLGIASQLKLNVQPYSVQDLDSLTFVLQKRLNIYASSIDSLRRIELDHNPVLFNEGIKSYKKIALSMPFLSYNYPSIKPSLYSHIGHYLGFTGYYNPFTGEAQIKTTVPFFLKPFVVMHEMGHQLGYAKENEANFVAFFAGRISSNTEFNYSVYYEMHQYAIRELYRRDSVKAKYYQEHLHSQVKEDTRELIAYLIRSKNPVEPWITSFYDEYLKMNNQPKGKATYNEVVAWLIAYQKKFGVEAI